MKPASDIKYKKSLASLAFGAVCTGLILWQLQFSTPSICCGDYDGYYHARWSSILRQAVSRGEFPPEFTWLPLTTLNPDDYTDHHLFFHLLQIPFTWSEDPRLGTKIGSWLFSVLALFACYWLIVNYRLSYPLLWLVAFFASSNTFLYRIEMTKAMSLSLVLMVAGIYLLFERKYVWLLPLTFLYVWTYSLWVMIGAASLIWTGVLLWSTRRLEWRPLVLTGLGAVLGFVINPYFPHNVGLFYRHVLMKATAAEFTTAVGGEWYPFTTWELLSYCLGACVSMFTGYICFRVRRRSVSEKPLFFLVFSTILLVATFRSRRWVEYWAPFAVLFAAFSLQPLLDVSGGIGQGGIRRVRKEFAVAAVIAILLVLAAFSNIRAARVEISQSQSHESFARGVEWVRRNVPVGEIIFNTDWDDFPKLFYYDPDHAYVSGLDPTYLFDKNPELAELYDRITLVKEAAPAGLIRERFGSRYVFTQHNDFYRNAVEVGGFEEVYRDDECAVLRIAD